jgi:hypothetical protein
MEDIQTCVMPDDLFRDEKPILGSKMPETLTPAVHDDEPDASPGFPLGKRVRRGRYFR